jgi:alpha-beta hydrolase superfamily lysophospholipase
MTHLFRSRYAQAALFTIALMLASRRTAQAQFWSGQAGPPQTHETLMIRGHAQALHLYGTRGNPPIIVSSGDGGWIHLGPHVAETLASHGFFVVGFDVKTYLSGFTSEKTTLRAEEEPGDYKVLADFAARGSTRKPILIGVSEGAGLSVLAATDPQTRASIAGVIGLGLPDINELGWRWRDSLIYITHGTPNEPTFSTAAIVKRVDSMPLCAIHSTRDEFVALSEVQRIFEAAREPKRLWVINASDHRFSDNLPEFNQRLLEAIDWIGQQAPPAAPRTSR